MTVQAVGLAHTTAHSHTVDGMPQTFLGYGYEKCHRRIGRAPGIRTGNSPKREGQGTEVRSTRAEQLFYRNEGAELIFFAEAILFHNRKSGVCTRKIEVERGSHRRCLGRRCLKIETQTGIHNRFGSSGAKRTYAQIALLEIGEVFQKRLNSLGAEEYEHVVVEGLIGSEIIAHRAIHHRRSAIELVLGQKGAVGAVVDVAHSKKELLGLVLQHRRHKIGKLAGLGCKDLAFAVYYILLEVVGDGFGCTEILQRHRNGDAHFFTKTEEIVDSGLGCENNCGKVGNIYFLCAKFFRAESFNLDERTENNLHVVFLSDLEIRRLIGSRLRLGYEDFFNLHFYRCLNSVLRGNPSFNPAQTRVQRQYRNNF